MASGKKKKKDRRGHPRSDREEALNHITSWANLNHSRPTAQSPRNSVILPLVELHTHSTCSDGMLTPTQLVERASMKGVNVLALTDHDTMAGVEEAMAVAEKLDIRVIPGVEISARAGKGELASLDGKSVHILAYYGCCGPSDCKVLEDILRENREGRFRRARSMVQKLECLNKPVKWERVLELAGDGGAPGRPHVARALLEEGHVHSLRDAFTKYLHDDGPAYASGDEISAEEVVHLVRRTGGVAALAHPWTLQNPRPLVRRLKAAGLHAMEAYRSGGKVAEFIQLAEDFDLLKLGGSDYHGIGTSNEVDLGQVLLPVKVMHEFLKLAQPIWSAAVKCMVHRYFSCLNRQHEPKLILEEFQSHTTHSCWKGPPVGEALASDKNLQIHEILKFSPWLDEEDRDLLFAEASKLGLEISRSTEISGRSTIILSGSRKK